ncbi:MAG: PleD family two-component system response regulator [Candidatus Hodarchaeota archaeon]
MISINERTHSKSLYDKKKENGILKENLQIVYNDKQIQQLGLSKELLREKLIEYEKETGKYAVWEGRITKTFYRYLTGQKIYERLKERISLYISPSKKRKWHKFIENNENVASFSKLIRVSVDYYIKHHLDSLSIESKMENKDFSNILLEVKESLTAIKGFSQLLLKEYKEDLNNQVGNSVEKIYEQCQLLESKISNSKGRRNIDILLIEDTPQTILLFEEIFKKKGYSYKTATTGQAGLNELKESIPKVVLLDVMLPDIVGWEVCKQIKKNSDLKHIPVFYETVIPEETVKSKIEETSVDGYILKPFDLSAVIELLDSIILSN